MVTLRVSSRIQTGRAWKSNERFHYERAMQRDIFTIFPRKDSQLTKSRATRTEGAGAVGCREP